MKHAFGIDLGTTNSCIAVKTEGQPAKIIRLADGGVTLPSCVMYTPEGVVVGREAYKHRYDVKHVVYSSKRDIGSDKTYTVYANGDDKPPIEVTPVDVACEILKKLKQDAELIYGKDYIKDVTITVPAYFTGERRRATLEAAKMAGLNVLALINEPTAAAIAYTEGKSGDEDVLVYDFGGGTFDVTLLSMLKPDDDLAELFGQEMLEDPMARVIASSGDPRLGGDDLDQGVFKLAALLASKEISAQLNEPVDITEAMSPEDIEHAILAIEEQKKNDKLTGLLFPVRLHFHEGEPDRIYKLKITTDMYAAALAPLYSRTRKLVRECMGNRKISDISKVILIGGSTKLQLLRDMMISEFGDKIHMALNPDEAVALGAATYTSILAGQTRMKISDVLPQSIGVEYTSIVGTTQLAGRFNIVLKKNTPLPANASVELSTMYPNQEQVDAPIYQGENHIAAANTPIGTVHLHLTPDEELQTVKVTLNVDASGVLSVTLNAGSKSVKAELQNILRPSQASLSKRETLALKYKLSIKQYAEADLAGYTECMRTIQDFCDEKCDFKEMTKVVNAFKKKMSSADQADSDAENKVTLTSFFANGLVADAVDDDEDDEADDNE